MIQKMLGRDENKEKSNKDVDIVIAKDHSVTYFAYGKFQILKTRFIKYPLRSHH